MTQWPVTYDDPTTGTPIGFRTAHNDLRATLTADAPIGSTTLTVDDTTTFENQGELVLSELTEEVTPEVVTYSGKTPTTFTGVSPTTKTWAIGDIASDGPTAKTHNDPISAIVAIQHELRLSAPLSPAQITATQNDYSPATLADINYLRLDLNADRTLTGLATGAANRRLVVVNLSAFLLTLAGQNAGSLAANRFIADIFIPAGGATLLAYDSISSRWRSLGGIGPHDHSSASDGGKISGGAVDTFLAFENASTPSAPASGVQEVFNQKEGTANTLGKLKIRDSSGQIRVIDELNTALVFNNSGSTIAALRAVFVSNISADGSLNASSISLVDPASSDHVDGVTLASIPNASFGRIITSGILEDQPTNTIGAGIIYVSATTPGLLTNSAPASGRLLVVGQCLYNDATKGKLLICPRADVAIPHTHQSQTTGGNTLNVGAFTVTDTFHFADSLFCTQITADQNNYTPTGIADHNVLNLSSDAARSITGIGAQSSYRLLGLFNRGSFTITFPGESASSSAANRIVTTFTLSPGQGALIWYDPDASRWRLFANGHARSHDHTLGDDGALGANVVSNTQVAAAAAIAVSKLANAGVAYALLRTNSAGNAVEWGLGGSIMFRSSQAGLVADAHAFDDYEEGSWVVALSTAGATYSAQTGTYTKKGRDISLHGILIINAIGASAATSAIAGIPFTAGGSYSSVSTSYFVASAINVVFLGGYIASSGTTIIITGLTAAAASVTSNPAIWTSGTQMILGGVYHT